MDGGNPARGWSLGPNSESVGRQLVEAEEQTKEEVAKQR